VKKWVKKHDRLLIIIGALVIFATFLVKDIYHDKAADLRSAIEAGEQAYLLTMRITNIEEGIEQSNETLKLIYAVVKDHEVPPGLADAFKGRQATKRIQNVRALLFAAQKLESLLNKKPEAQCVEKMVNELGDIQVKYVTHEAEYSERLLSGATFANMCAASVVKEARVVEQNSEWWSGFWTYMSYGLFGFGWLLTLIGKLVKDEKIEGGLE
jgi:hypothetical protein